MKLDVRHSKTPWLFMFLLRIGKRLAFIRCFLNGVCESCGKWIGMASVVSRHGFQCWPCNDLSNSKGKKS